MPSRRIVLSIAVAAAVLAAAVVGLVGTPRGVAQTTAPAADTAAPSFTRFDQADFDRALAAGEPVVVHVHADWCTTCRAQLKTFAAIGEAGFRDARLLRVDYDTDFAFLKRFNVRSQSTILVFKGGKEVSRLVGETGREAIQRSLAKI